MAAPNNSFKRTGPDGSAVNSCAGRLLSDDR